MRKNRINMFVNSNHSRTLSKAFTLIELLAIIVILAIIAVITIPMMNKTINNSKKGAAIDSAYGYASAVYRYYMTEMIDDYNGDLPTGTYNISDLPSDFKVSGEAPSEGWVELEDGEVIAFSLKFNNYVVTKYKDTEAETVKNGEIAENLVAREARLELERQTQAKSDAKTLATSQTGTTGIVEITDGWVAFINGEVVAYSVKVTEGDYTYVVTDLDVDSNNTNAVANRNTTELASTASTEERIVSYKVDSYVKAALTANSSLTADTVKTVSEMSGITTNAADSGWIQFEYKNSTLNVKDYSLQYGSLNANYSSLTSGNYVSTFGSLRPAPMTLGIKVGNVQYYTGGSTANPDNAVYFDPINGTKNCTTYDASNSTTGYNGTGATGSQTTCLKWFIYSIDDKGTESEADDVVNMILDHNTTGGIAWHESNNYTGPNSTFLTQLTNDTSAWISNKLISPSAYTASWTYSSTARTYTITYTTKARLIEADEVAKIKGDSSWTYTTSTSVITTNNYNFLKANLSTSGGTNVAYWTSSPNAGYSFYAWYVSFNAYLNCYYVFDTDYGVRPVVSILKSDVL